MRALSATELLGVRERGFSQPPVQQALTLLAAACPESPPAALADLTVGQRDARLLELRELTFGPEVSALAACPACREHMELNLNLGELLTAARQRFGVRQSSGALVSPRDETEPGPEAKAPAGWRSPEPGGGTGAAMELNVDGHEVRFRLPNSSDLMAIANGGDFDARRSQLLDRCLLSGHDHLPAKALAGVVEHMAHADPLADIQLSLSCSACGHAWGAPFDIASFFWRELDAWARGILREVHTLAVAYGWREADILALSPARRRCYLEMAEG